MPSKLTIEEIQELFSDILEDAQKGERAETKEDMRRFAQSILDTMSKLQRALE